MPGRRCAMYGCNNCYFVTRKNDSGIGYHSFPRAKDFVTTTIRKEWIRRCKRADVWNPDNSQICSVHFTETDYERDMRNEILGLPVRKLLKKSAVPSLNLPNKPKNISSDREKRFLKKKELAEERHQKDEMNMLVDEASTSTVSQTPQETHQCNETLNVGITTYLTGQEDKAEDLSLKYNNLLKSHNKLQAQFQAMKRKFNLQQKQLRYYKMKSLPKESIPKVKGENLLKKILTDNQVALLLNKKKRVNWTTEEIAVAFTLRYLSKKSYVYLRSKLNFPLPALSTLRKWSSKISIKEGILEDVLTFLKVAGENMSTMEKTIVIMFDEVKIKSTLEYDVGEDQVLGSYNLMQVCMVRSLFSNWKQPIYIGFDKKMTRENLMNIITKLYEISYNCVAIVSDCGGSNVGLWKDLSVDINKTYFSHPETQKNIYVFADAPHLLKLLRNWLLDTGFVLGEKTKINKKPLEHLIELTDTEVNSCYKISEKHITVEKSQRQNVRLAAELLSRTTAQALLRYKPGLDKKLAEDLGNFISDVDSWFDLFNSHIKESPDPNPMKAPFGIHLEQQEEHLDRIKSIIMSMKAEGKGSLQIFQKGIIMSIESLKCLLHDMKNEFKEVHYLCTHKLNQDCLENFFFQIRCRGPNEHPSPLEALKRIRMIILGKNPGILDAQVNTQETAPEEYIVARVLEKANVSIDVALDEESENTVSKGNASGSSSSFSSTASESFDMNSQETTEDAMEYIAGFIAKKFKRSHPQLGDYTYKVKCDHTYSLPSWVQQLSFGGLIKPTLEFLKTIKKWNKYFEKYHGNSNIRKEPLVVKKLVSKISKRENYPVDIIRLFCKLRTIIRLNYLNAKNIMEKNQKVKRKCTRISNSDVKRKLVKKMGKIVK